MSDLSHMLSKHLREVHFGDNWTCVHLQEILSDVSWQQAVQKIGPLHTIVALTYHIHYYVRTIAGVLEGQPLDAHDKYSFDHPAITSAADWATFKETVFSDAERLAGLIASLPESRLWEYFTSEKYGTYYRNIQGVTEHTHYHLGQISLIKKLLQEQAGNNQGVALAKP